jgi:hypothetical protein
MDNQPKHLIMLPHFELLSSAILCTSTEKAASSCNAYLCNAYDFGKWLVPISARTLAILIERFCGFAVSGANDGIVSRIRSF